MASKDISRGLKTLDLQGDDYILVAAIDFGTTYSGFAFATRNDPGKTIMNTNWGAELGHKSYKTPTSVLTNPKGEFVSFGFTAENDYSVKLESDSAAGYNLYRNFKMMLHNQKITINSKITSTTGTKREAIDIFTMALRFLKDQLFHTLKQSKIVTIEGSLIRWVLTVPAIWTDSAKRFMREASFRAGLISEPESNSLIIALEPEAASMYCRGLEVKLCHDGDEKSTGVTFTPGEKYLIIDAGGGTVDITVHEMQLHGKVKEIHPPSGGPWGGIMVDQNFHKLMDEILGQHFMAHYKSSNPQDWMSFMLHFEQAKMSVKEREQKNINIQLTWSMADEFETYTTKEIDKVLNKKTALGVNFNNGAMTIHHDRAVKLFLPVVGEITTHVKSLLQKAELAGVKYILIVGGFGQTDLLQNAIRKEFERGKSILIPTEAQLAIVKGAVMFGFHPSNITSRISKYTYGFGKMVPFVKGLHDVKKKCINFGQEYCNNIFETAIKTNEEVLEGKDYEFQLLTGEYDAKVGYSSLAVYHSSANKVMYTDESGVVELGRIKIPYKGRGQRKIPYSIHFIFGGTEILVRAKNRETGKSVETQVDFLSDIK